MQRVGTVRQVPSREIYKWIPEPEVSKSPVLGHMRRVGTVRQVPGREVYKRIAEAQVLLVRSLDQVKNRTRFSKKSEKLALVKDSDISTDARETAKFQMACKSPDITAAEEVRGLPDIIVPEERSSSILEHLSERQRGRHNEAVTSLHHELACIAREMEPFILEPGRLLHKKLVDSDRKIELLFKDIELDAALKGFSVEGLEELWNTIRQECLTRRKWIREMDESLLKAEKSRASEITGVLRKYTLTLEEIGAFSSADVHKFMDDKAMTINRALLSNRREIAKLFFNLMKSDMMKELSHRLKWEDRVEDWKVIQKNNVVHSFREFMANEEIQNPPTVKTEMENMITHQILLSQRRLELLQHLGDLLPPTHTEADVGEWYKSLENVNRSMDTHHVQSVTKIRLQYEMVQQKCLAELQLCKNNLLNLKLCTQEEAEEIVNSELLPLAEKLQNRFEEELEHMDRDFKELANQNEQSCRDLYSYFQEAMGLWGVHQEKLSQQEGDLQKKLNECRRKQDNIIQRMDADLDIILKKMKTASSEENLKAYLKSALSSLDDIRARYGTFSQVLMDEVTPYPGAVLQELISYSTSISQYFHVKEIFKQDVFNSSKAESSENDNETFSTSSGNSYTVFEETDTGIPKTYFTKYESKGSLPVYLKDALINETMFVDLKKRVRLCFFEHLEKWFAESVSRSHVLVADKKEELNSELQMRLHSHQQRCENIETNICNARAAELVHHKERLEHHCAGVVEALEKEKAEFLKFYDQQDNLMKNLHSRICEMESVYLNTARTEKLTSLSNSMQTELQNHLEVFQAALRSYRKDLEDSLGKLKDSNAEFLKACRLSLEGGNFSAEELQSVSKRLQKESKRIDTFESLIMADMEKVESSCLEKATKLIDQTKTRFHYIFMNREFMEKIRRFLTNLRVQIKSEVANSNMQAETLKSSLNKLRQKRDTYANPSADKEALTSEELHDFVKVVLKELKKRSQYLDCVRVKAVKPHDKEDLTPLERDVKLQGPTDAAIRRGCCHRLRNENRVALMGMDPEKHPLLSPSRMGKSALDDLAIGVIKSLLDIQPSGKSSGPKQAKDRSRPLQPAMLPTLKKDSHLKVSKAGPGHSTTDSSAAQHTRKSPPKEKMTSKLSSKKKMSTRRIQLVRERYQIFGEKPPEAETFKGIIMNVLWTGNNSLLSLAEEFYKEMNPQMELPEDLPETFEDCAQQFKQTLLSYQRQTEDYYNSCLKEFQDQLSLFEKELAYVPRLATDRLLKEHEQKLRYSISQIHHRFNKQMKEWEKVRVVHKTLLKSSLGHPQNLLKLETLCCEETKRQKDQVDGIHLNTQALQDCAAECARNFVSALAALTEELLLDLDETITSDDIEAPKTKSPKKPPSTLPPQRQAGLPLCTCDVERGSRTWPGIPRTTLPGHPDDILCKETASVTTAKTTLGHIAAEEARDAAYKEYICQLEQQFSQMREKSTAQLLAVQGWEEWWKRSVWKIKRLYE
ncbi:coiled-coil domain-containing protein 180 [Athene cunicularia]|uniref:coiled-coil domain-containing protein 180 n=1 Tax=Athene cunicularia TaxID=194338 RepID=UPI000EF6D0B8|nr:coiled-coil domain-containing protein 180 [Athene cunicularia]